TGRRVPVVGRQVLQERAEVALLLVVAGESHWRMLADDRHDRLMVEVRVVETVEEMDRTGAGRCETDADLAGPLRVRACHEGGHLLVARLDELQLVLVALERTDDRVDPVAR